MADIKVKDDKLNKKEDAAHRERMTTVPLVDIFEEENNITLIGDMPGVSKDDLDLNIEKDVLHIYGKIQAADEKSPQYSEFREMDYYRAFNISDGIDTDKIDASLNNGVLKVVLPKSERLKPKKIEIKY